MDLKIALIGAASPQWGFTLMRDITVVLSGEAGLAARRPLLVLEDIDEVNLEKMHRLEEDALIVNRYGCRMRGTGIGGGIHRLAKRAGVELSSLHQFRHSCASELLVNGINLPKVQKILGHASVSSTMRYIDITDPERKQAMELHPINEFVDKYMVADLKGIQHGA